jgi:hypothetical protein
MFIYLGIKPLNRKLPSYQHLPVHEFTTHLCHLKLPMEFTNAPLKLFLLDVV